MTESAPGPLAGLLVVDFSRVLAGPFATMMMADLGARVVKVERPGRGDDSRGYGPFLHGASMYFARVNRGKSSIALDLTDPADAGVLWGLLAAADVVVENFRPGVMTRLGLGYDAVAARNPGVVYASVSGFGQTGPEREKPAYDAVVQAMSGLMAVTGSADGPPVKPGIPVADLAGGLFAFGGVCAALTGRAATGRGTHVDVAMYDAAVSLLEGAALRYLVTGESPPRIGNAHHSIAPFDTFAVADGQIVICAAHDGLFLALCETLGRPQLAEDPAYRTNAARSEHREALKVELEAALSGGGAAQWLARLTAARVPCGPVQTVAEAVDSAQVRDRRMLVDAGGLPVPGNPVKMSAYDDPATRPAAPRLDADGPSLRAEFGVSPGAERP